MSFQLSEAAKKFVQAEVNRYESRTSAIIRCLYRAQEENNGWVSRDVIDQLSKAMDIPPAAIDEVATFYTMFNLKPIGRYHLQVCCTLSCAMAGGRELTAFIMKECGVNKLGETSQDGLFTVSKVECLGSCDTAPMLQVNREVYNENLNEAKTRELIQKLRADAAANKVAHPVKDL